MSRLIRVMIVCMMASITIAAETDIKKKETPKTKYPGTQMKSRARSRNPQQRQRFYEQTLARRAETHQKAIAELAAIKTIAEEEGATRTIAAIQKLIDQKNLEYKKSTTRFEEQRRSRAEQVQKSQAEKKPVEKADDEKMKDKEEK